MAEERIQRRLAAILAADVVGYSRMMEADESGTLARLTALRNELLHPKVTEYGGRIVKTTGDGTLIEFPSAVDALQHAIEVQQEMARRGADQPESFRLRMGINVGDIIISQDDIYGDGVNIAARLESLSDPGGICLSGTVYEHVRNKLDVDLEDLGPKSVKNIDAPVRVYRVRLEGDAPREHAEAPEQTRRGPKRLRPSIAVLPFENMSGDPEQEYFADGIAEDIITALARFRWFYVIARNSSFSYKGTSPDIRKVSSELGVRYVLEGSVRKAGNRVRISAQLIDGATGNHLWAQSYDRDLDDIFAIQDEITRTVVGAIEPELGKAERERARRQRPENMDAWDFYHQGTAYLYKRTKADLSEAIRQFDRAIEADPNFAQAYAARAFAHYFKVIYSFSDEIERDRAEAIKAARRAVDLDNDDPMAHTALGMASYAAADMEAAAASLQKAVDLNPGSAGAHSLLGLLLSYLDRDDEALTHHHVALELGVRDPALPVFMGRMGMTCLSLGRVEDALKWSERAIQTNANIWPPFAQLAWIYMELGRQDDAREIVAQLRRINPDLRAVDVEQIVSLWDPDRDAVQRRVGYLRAAGLPG